MSSKETFVDLSHDYEDGMPVPDWPGEHRQEFELDEFSVTVNTGTQNNLRMNIHCGTHIDAPYHYWKEGLRVNEIPLNQMVGPCKVVDMSRDALGVITADDLKEHVKDVEKGDMLFVRTSWEEKWGTKEYETLYPYFDESAGKLMTSLGISVLGIDTPGPDAPIRSGHRKGDPLHVELLSNNIPILENLANLKSVIGKKVYVYAFPIRIAKSTGAPVRVVATELR